jgi:hypothetical protein
MNNYYLHFVISLLILTVFVFLQRMHQNVLRDIILEEESLKKKSAKVDDCPSGICDLSNTRFRDPKTASSTS